MAKVKHVNPVRIQEWDVGRYGTAKLGFSVDAIAPVVGVNLESWNKGFEVLMEFSSSLDCVSLVALRARTSSRLK